MRRSPPLLVDARDAVVLGGWISDPAQPALAQRAQIVLLCSDGHGPSAVADRVCCSKQTVIAWRERYRNEGLAGLRDAPRPGRPVTVDPDAVVLATVASPGPGGGRWSTRSLGAQLGISNVAVGNVWRDWGIRPEAQGRVSLRTEPVLNAAVVDVLGLFVDPPVYVFAVQVDERTAAVTAPQPRPAVGGLLADLLVAEAGTGGSRALTTFLDQLRRTRDLSTATTPALSTEPMTEPRTALLVTGETESVRHHIRGRDAVALHTVTGVAVWERLVRVGCLLAGADRGGAASVEALRIAVAGHGDGLFSWISPA